MLVSLPMYDFEEVSDATAALWAALRRQMLTRAPDLDLPVRYFPTTDIEDLYQHWRTQDLLLSQTCGYPLTHDLRGQVQYVATPVYSAPGCTGRGDYCSLIVTHKKSGITHFEKARGTRFAFNGRDSQSGYNAMRWMIQGVADCDPEGFFGEEVKSGGHRQSLALVAQGRADICAVDCVTFALIDCYRPQETASLRIVDQSPPAPALPFITSLDTRPSILASLRESLKAIATDPSIENARESLFLKNFSVLPLQSYDRICDKKVVKTTSYL